MRNALWLRIGTLLLGAVVLLACGLGCGLGCGKKEKADQAATGAAPAGAPTTTADSGAAAAAPFGAPATAPAAPAASSSAAATAPAPAAGSAPEAAAPGAQSAAAPEAATGVPAVLTPADVDAYRRGQEAELARIEKLLDELGAAKDDAEKEALFEQLNDRTASEEQGARAAKMEVARYQAVSATIDEMIMRWRRSVFVSRMTADTTRIANLPPERQVKIRAAVAAAKTPYAGLPPATVDAVAPRVAELDSLRVITGSLVNQALRAAKAPPDAGGAGGSGHP